MGLGERTAVLYDWHAHTHARLLKNSWKLNQVCNHTTSIRMFLSPSHAILREMGLGERTAVLYLHARTLIKKLSIQSIILRVICVVSLRVKIRLTSPPILKCSEVRLDCTLKNKMKCTNRSRWCSESVRASKLQLSNDSLVVSQSTVVQSGGVEMGGLKWGGCLHAWTYTNA